MLLSTSLRAHSLSTPGCIWPVANCSARSWDKLGGCGSAGGQGREKRRGQNRQATRKNDASRVGRSGQEKNEAGEALDTYSGSITNGSIIHPPPRLRSLMPRPLRSLLRTGIGLACAPQMIDCCLKLTSVRHSRMQVRHDNLVGCCSRCSESCLWRVSGGLRWAQHDTAKFTSWICIMDNPKKSSVDRVVYVVEKFLLA